MQHIKLKKGLDLQLAGPPEQQVSGTLETDTVAITSFDFPCLQPEFCVQEGDSVTPGQALFSDRHNPELQFTAPLHGIVETISTGRRRTLDTLVIKRNRSADHSPKTTAGPADDRKSLQTLLLERGLWPAFRTRPFNRVPAPRSVPANIFVTAMDSNPLAADPRAVLTGESESFKTGVAALPALTDGNVYVCQSPGSPLSALQDARIIDVAFSGPHPSGNAGTHIHFLAPVNRHRMAWYLDYQDVIALGHLIRTGSLLSTRVVALAGPGILKPRLVRTMTGANLQELLVQESVAAPVVVYSGSVLNARRSQWLGRYHSLVTVMRAEQPANPKPHWIQCLQNFSAKHTSSNRSVISEYWLDKVSPLNILPVPLLRSLALGDLEQAESLGCLELSEEDIAPWSWVCPSQTDYASLLNACLVKTAESMP